MATKHRGKSGGVSFLGFLRNPFSSKEKPKQSDSPDEEKRKRTRRRNEERRSELSSERKESKSRPARKKLQSKPVGKESQCRTLRKKRQSIPVRMKRQSRPVRKKRQHRPFYEDHKRLIVVEVEPGYPTRRGIAMVDPHCPDDLISRSFARHIGFRIKSGSKSKSKSKRGKQISTTIMGERIRRMAKIHIRWYLDQTDIRFEDRMCMDPTFHDGSFLITNAESRFDIIIGSRTIEKLRLLDRGRSFIAPFFRSPPPKIDESSVSAERAKADERRKREQEEMEREQERKARERSNARRSN